MARDDNWVNENNSMTSFSEQEEFVEDYKLQAKLRYQRRKKHSNLYPKYKKSRKNKQYND